MASDAGGSLRLVDDLKDRYRFLAKLGSGGMADVFLGIQRGEEGFERLVVIKKIHTRWMKREDSAIKMFIDEARTIASLNHPQIVKVFDLSRMGEDICITMEYVDGENLEYISASLKKSNKRFPLPVACTLMIQACDALHYAHSASAPDGTPLKLVHRDVGPHNIMLDSNGYLKIIDFGIAKSTARGDLTTPGVIKGKLSYLAPDIFKFKDIDGRIDLYALGLVFYRMITLKTPFRYESDVTIAEVINKIFKDPLPKPSSVFKDLPKELDAIIEKVTHRDRKKRYQTGEEFAEAIREFAQKHGGLATNTEVKKWFLEQFKARLAKRREFDRMALEKAKSLAQESAEEPEGTPQLSIPITTDEIRKAPQVTTPPPSPRRRLSPFLLLFVALVGLAAGAAVVYQIFLKNPTDDRAGPAQPAQPTQQNLQVVSIPQQADLFIDGEKVGSTGAHGINVRIEPGKEHRIEVRKEGFKPYILTTRGESFGQRKIEARLVDSAAPETDEAKKETRNDSVKVAAVPKPEPGKTRKPPAQWRRRGKMRRRIKYPPSRPSATSEPAQKPKEPPIVEEKPEPTSDPAVVVDKRPAPEPEPKKEPEVPKVASTTPVRWFSGSGEWSGKKVIIQGCARCHNGGKAEPFEFAIKTRRQWERFFKRKRHNRRAKLDRYFSPTELRRGLKFILEQITKGKKSGIAGVK